MNGGVDDWMIGCVEAGRKSGRKEDAGHGGPAYKRRIGRSELGVFPAFLGSSFKFSFRVDSRDSRAIGGSYRGDAEDAERRRKRNVQYPTRNDQCPRKKEGGWDGASPSPSAPARDEEG